MLDQYGYGWLEPVLIAAAVVFIIDLIGNTLTFSSRFLNALVTAIIFAVVFGALVYFGYGGVQMTVHSEPAANAPATGGTTSTTTGSGG